MKWFSTAVLVWCVSAVMITEAVAQGSARDRVASRTAIEQLYLDILGREAKVDEVQHWQAELVRNGGKIGEVRKHIILSKEAENAINHVVRKHTGKNATADELKRVRKEMGEGRSLAELDARLARRR